MRNPERIPEFCNKLAEIWQRYPDFRFSQMLLNFFHTIDRDAYFMEDEETIKRLETWMDGNINPRKKYRKKPIIIEAYQTEQEKDIKTLEGTMHASVGDYIITGVDGEQYPCKPDIFEKTYELVGE